MTRSDLISQAVRHIMPDTLRFLKDEAKCLNVEGQMRSFATFYFGQITNEFRRLTQREMG
jgi:hypothetical protein